MMMNNQQQQAGSPNGKYFIKVKKATYPITGDIIRQAMKSFGELSECNMKDAQTDTRDGNQFVDGTVTFANPEEGQRAFESLRGKPIYPDCCFLSMFPWREGNGMGGGRGGGIMHGGMGRGGMMMGGRGGMGGRGRGFGAPMMMGGGYNNQMMMQQQQGGMMMGGGHHHHHHHHGGMMGGMNMGYQQHHHHHQQMMSQPGFFVINGLSDTLPLLKLFHLLEHYAVVLGIRRQERPPNMGIILFGDFNDGIVAAKMVSGVTFYGMKLDIRPFPSYSGGTNFAPTPETSMITDPSDAGCKTYDFTSFRHRKSPHKPSNFRPSKDHPACNSIFIGNLLLEITDQEVRDHIEKIAQENNREPFKIVEFERYSPVHVVVSLPTVEEAVEFSVLINGSNLKQRYLKASFSGFEPFKGPPSTFDGTAPRTAHRLGGGGHNFNPHHNQHQQHNQQQQAPPQQEQQQQQQEQQQQQQGESQEQQQQQPQQTDHQSGATEEQQQPQQPQQE